MTQKAIELYRTIEKSYTPTAMNCVDDDDRMLRIKRAIRFDLTPSERVVFVLYAHFGSLRKLAKAFNSSKTTMRLIVLGIQKKIKKRIGNALF